MPARFNGRTNSRNNSGSRMAENPAHLVVHARLRPVGMLAVQTRRLHFARRPVKPFGQPQPPCASHGAQGRELLRAGLFIRQHEKIMRQKNGSRKRRANDGEYMKPFSAEVGKKQKQEAANYIRYIFAEHSLILAFNK